MIAQAYENPAPRPNQVSQNTQNTQPTSYEQPEDRYHTIVPQSHGTKYTLEADGEVKEIIDSISPELRNAFVILAIKNLKNDSLYGSFFKVKAPEEIKEELLEAESLAPQGPMMSQQNMQQMQQTSSAPEQSPQTQALNDTFREW
jgi:hypothetical protein